mgnify:CR=1 FL=1
MNKCNKLKSISELQPHEKKIVFNSLKKKFPKANNYKQNYFDFFGYDKSDFILCEIPNCGKVAVDIHHIENRGAGGTKAESINDVGNLMALCREHHVEYGEKKHFKEYLFSIHNKLLGLAMAGNGV